MRIQVGIPSSVEKAPFIHFYLDRLLFLGTIRKNPQLEVFLKIQFALIHTYMVLGFVSDVWCHFPWR